MEKNEMLNLLETLNVNGFLNKDEIIKKYSSSDTNCSYTLLYRLIEDYMRNENDRITIYGSTNSGKTILLNYIRYEILEKNKIKSDFIFIDGLKSLEVMKEEYISKFFNKYKKVSDEVIKLEKQIIIADKIPSNVEDKDVLYIKVDSNSIETKGALEYIIYEKLNSDGFCIKNMDVKNYTLDENIFVELNEQQLPKY